jgi:hypothetical protein
MSCFSFSLFSSAKSENRQTEQFLPVGKVGTIGKGEVSWKGSRRLNAMQKKCVYMQVNAIMVPVEIVP